MSAPLKRAHIKALEPSLQAWGDAEYQLRTLHNQVQRSDLGHIYRALCVRELTRTLYQQRGMSVTAHGLCQAYDLLRHGRPVDFDLLLEARHTRDVLLRTYAGDTALTAETLDAWLRAMITLANTIGTYEPNVGGPLLKHGLANKAAKDVFDIPPGPLDALRRAIRETCAASPPLLAVVSLLNDLEAFEMLFPTSIDLAVPLLLPGLMSYAFAVPATALFAVPDKAHWVQLGRLANRAQSISIWLETIAHDHAEALRRADHQRRGSRLPALLARIAVEPLFTAPGVSKTLKTVPRTIEKLVSRLNQAGLIHPLQRSGRLIIWAKR